MRGCSRCEALPPGPPEAGVLYVAPPLPHTRSTVRTLLGDSGLRFDEPVEGVLAVEVGPEELRSFGTLVRGRLSGTELRDSRTLLVEKGVEPALRELARMQDLDTLVAATEGEWLVDMIREKRFTVHFQPIVPVSETTEAFAYECLLRGLDRGGSVVDPGRMFGVARSAGILFNLDRMARTRAIEEATRFGVDANIFINFNPTSIYDPVYCLRSTIEAAERCGISPGRVVFEVTESDEVHDAGHLLKILDYYREAGFRVALDDLGAGYSSLNLLTAIRPDFVKLDTALISGVDGDPYKALVSSRIIGLAGELGVGVVAEGIETEEQLRWVRENGADYVQGFLLARPGSPPPLLSPVHG